MIEWAVKKIVVGKVNGLLMKYKSDVSKVREKLVKWTGRLEKALACFKALLSKLDDNQLTADECKQARSEISDLVKSW